MNQTALSVSRLKCFQAHILVCCSPDILAGVQMLPQQGSTLPNVCRLLCFSRSIPIHNLQPLPVQIFHHLSRCGIKMTVKLMVKHKRV